TAYRDGIDLILKVNGTDDQVTITRQFEGRQPGLFGGDASDDTGVEEIAFLDGVVWDKMDIARLVSHPLAGNETLIGTGDIDYLDGGAGDDFLSGGDDHDSYVAARATDAMKGCEASWTERSLRFRGSVGDSYRQRTLVESFPLTQSRMKVRPREENRPI